MAKKIPAVILLVLVLASFTYAFTYAWWVTIEFKPDASEIDHILISEIDKTWKTVKVLSMDAIPKEALESDPYDPIKEFGYIFSYVGDLNKDGIEDKAMVGVYEDTSGNFGRFLLVLTRSKKNWEMSFLSKIPGNPGFSILWFNKGTLIWSVCMECGSHGELRWDGKRYSVDWSKSN